MILIVAFAILLLGSAGPGLAKEQSQIVFAFANRAGTHLLTVRMETRGSASAHNPELLNRALCAGNRLLEVAFEEHQASGPHNTGRQTSHNFEQMEGDRYRITNGKVRDDEVCLLADSPFFSSRQLLPMQRERPYACPAEVNALLSATGKRSVKRCLVLADLDRTQFVAAEFEPMGKDLLAALALVGEGKLSLHPDKAECDGSSAWRVDDGCEFDPAHLVPLFALKRQDAEIELAFEWPAPEAGALILYRSSGDRLEEVAVASRYWAPF